MCTLGKNAAKLYADSQHWIANYFLAFLAFFNRFMDSPVALVELRFLRFLGGASLLGSAVGGAVGAAFGLAEAVDLGFGVLQFLPFMQAEFMMTCFGK